MTRQPGRPLGRKIVLAVVVVVSPTVADRPAAAQQLQAATEDKDDGSFGFTTPIACKEINGYEDYVELPNAALTCDEKLLVYFKPRHYKSARKGDKFEAHFVQDCRVRRRGQKAVIWSKNNILDYKVATDTPPQLIYLSNKLSLKSLKPGEYDYDIVLRDTVGKSTPIVRTMPFTILPSPEPTP